MSLDMSSLDRSGMRCPEAKAINTIRILWGEPYAVDFQVQRWSGEDPINDPALGRWIDIDRVRGNAATESKLKLATNARYIRVLMTHPMETGQRKDAASRRRERRTRAIAKASPCARSGSTIT